MAIVAGKSVGAVAADDVLDAGEDVSFALLTVGSGVGQVDRYRRHSVLVAHEVAATAAIQYIRTRTSSPSRTIRIAVEQVVAATPPVKLIASAAAPERVVGPAADKAIVPCVAIESVGSAEVFCARTTHENVIASSAVQAVRSRPTG